VRTEYVPSTGRTVVLKTALKLDILFFSVPVGVLCVQLCPQSQTNYGEQGDSENPIIKFLLLGGILSTALLPTKHILKIEGSESANSASPKSLLIYLVCAAGLATCRKRYSSAIQATAGNAAKYSDIVLHI
jgi:hypothetical protein